MIKQEIIELLKANSIFSHSPIHGFSHWKRVEANGLYLAGVNGADKAVISYFAYFHDCMRENEDIDHGHCSSGKRLLEFSGSYIKSKKLTKMLKKEILSIILLS
ncbi:MAG: hypothetical protein AB7V07_02675 [Candidatus Delongbacteria bacterium]